MSAFYFLFLQDQFPVIHARENAAPDLSVVVRVVEDELVGEGHVVNADLLGEFAPGARLVGFAGENDAPGGDVVVAGENVLRGGAFLHAQVAAGVEDQNVGAAVREAVLAHVAAGRGPDDVVLVIDDSNDFIGRGPVQVQTSRRPGLLWGKIAALSIGS